MPIALHLWSIAARVPQLFGGALLHRTGLEALHRGYPALADRLFEGAAAAYRRELRVEALARLRVHQLIARVRVGSGPEAVSEVERLLACLERIEGLEPPFEVVGADGMLARFLEDCREREVLGRAA